MSWADFLIGYSNWLAPCSGGARELLSSDNGSYKRDILFAYGSELDAMMDAESVQNIQWSILKDAVYAAPCALPR